MSTNELLKSFSLEAVNETGFKLLVALFTIDKPLAEVVDTLFDSKYDFLCWLTQHRNHRSFNIYSEGLISNEATFITAYDLIGDYDKSDGTFQQHLLSTLFDLLTKEILVQCIVSDVEYTTNGNSANKDLMKRLIEKLNASDSLSDLHTYAIDYLDKVNDNVDHWVYLPGIVYSTQRIFRKLYRY